MSLGIYRSPTPTFNISNSEIIPKSDIPISLINLFAKENSVENLLTQIEILKSKPIQEIKQVLLEKDDDENTVLHLAANDIKYQKIAIYICKDILPLLQDFDAKEILTATNENKQTPFFRAARNSSLNVCETFILNAEKLKLNIINARDIWDNAPFHLCAFNNTADVVKYIVSKGADINAVNTDGVSPSFWAAENKNLEVLEEFIQIWNNSGIDITTLKDNDQSTILLFASSNQNTKALETLLQYIKQKYIQKYGEADYKNHFNTFINLTNKFGHNALHVDDVSFDNFKLLINAGVDINCKNNDGDTPIHNMLKNIKLDECKKFLAYLESNNIDILSTKENGGTFLHATASHNDSKVFEVLFTYVKSKFIEKYGESDGLEKLKEYINHQNNTNYTALHNVVRKDNFSIENVQLLLQSGANPMLQDTAYGDNPLALAANFKQNVEDVSAFIQEIEKQGYDIKSVLNQQNKREYTAIILPAHYGYIDICKLFIEKGVDLSILCNYQFSILHTTVEKANWETVKFILDATKKAGLEFITQNSRYGYPLHRAASFSSDTEVIKKLVEYGSPIYEKDATFFHTPLQRAAFNDSKEIYHVMALAIKERQIFEIVHKIANEHDISISNQEKNIASINSILPEIASYLPKFNSIEYKNLSPEDKLQDFTLRLLLIKNSIQVSIDDEFMPLATKQLETLFKKGNFGFDTALDNPLLLSLLKELKDKSKFKDIIGPYFDSTEQDQFGFMLKEYLNSDFQKTNEIVNDFLKYLPKITPKNLSACLDYIIKNKDVEECTVNIKKIRHRLATEPSLSIEQKYILENIFIEKLDEKKQVENISKDKILQTGQGIEVQGNLNIDIKNLNIMSTLSFLTGNPLEDSHDSHSAVDNTHFEIDNIIPPYYGNHMTGFELVSGKEPAQDKKSYMANKRDIDKFTQLLKVMHATGFQQLSENKELKLSNLHFHLGIIDILEQFKAKYVDMGNKFSDNKLILNIVNNIGIAFTLIADKYHNVTLGRKWNSKDNWDKQEGNSAIEKKHAYINTLIASNSNGTLDTVEGIKNFFEKFQIKENKDLWKDRAFTLNIQNFKHFLLQKLGHKLPSNIPNVKPTVEMRGGTYWNSLQLPVSGEIVKIQSKFYDELVRITKKMTAYSLKEPNIDWSELLNPTPETLKSMPSEKRKIYNELTNNVIQFQRDTALAVFKLGFSELQNNTTNLSNLAFTYNPDSELAQQNTEPYPLLNLASREDLRKIAQDLGWSANIKVSLENLNKDLKNALHDKLFSQQFLDNPYTARDLVTLANWSSILHGAKKQISHEV